uniref:SOCS box domain-containing protein n=1 Tax=Timema cristinae TaxID=61476 RepID=A0A7R9CCW7_TIMCR|nr:unnamed protein product [Timema cristinae]
MVFPPSLTVLCLQELCCRAIVARTTVYGIDQLPLPTSIKSHLKSYAMTNTSNQHRYVLNHIGNRGSVGGRLAHHKKLRFVGGVSSTGMMSPSPSSGSPTGVDSSRTSCTDKRRRTLGGVSGISTAVGWIGAGTCLSNGVESSSAPRLIPFEVMVAFEYFEAPICSLVSTAWLSFTWSSSCRSLGPCRFCVSISLLSTTLSSRVDHFVVYHFACSRIRAEFGSFYKQLLNK